MTTARNIEAVLPLTPMQEGMLFGTLVDPGGGAYVEQAVFRFRGELDAAALHAAWQRAAARHQPLRAAFFWEGREDPLQVALRDVEVPLQRLDWRDLDEAGRESALEELLLADRRRGFDLTRAPLMRLTLARLGERRHLLLWSHHHLILDGWSVARLLREVLELYAGGGGEMAPAFPYRRFVAWLENRERGADEAHWRAALEGLGEPVAMPVIAPRETRRGAVGGAPVVDAAEGDGEDHSASAASREAVLRLPRRRRERLEAGARDAGVTLGTLTQAALGLLISRYTASREVVFGVTVAGRPETLPGVETAVGLFINTLPLRLSLDPEQPADRYLEGVQRRAARDREHGFEALPRLHAWSGLVADTPLFETVLVFENYPRAEGAPVPGVELELEETQLHEKTDYPLTLVVVPEEDGLKLTAAYDPGRVGEEAAGGVLRHLAAAMTWLAEAGGEPLAHARLLEPEEEERLLELARRRRVFEVEEGEEGTLHGRFARVAAQHRDEVAVSAGEETLTYGELERRSRELADDLRRRGAGPETLVGLCLPRGADLVVALLAILRTGAAYLPLDPEYPQERLRGMLADSGARLVVTDGDLRRRMSFLRAGREAGGVSAPPAGAVPGQGGPDHLAYVIYTSGSTGRPKGVAVTHRNVLRLFAACGGDFDFGPGSVWSLFHSYAFDFSVWELWGALLHGGRVVVVPPEVSRSPERFAELLATAGVTHLSQTPSAFRELVALEEATGVTVGPSLEWVVFGGEALDPRALAPWIEVHGDETPALVNMYGITETTVHVTFRRVRAADVGRAVSPVGRGLADLSTPVLDPAGHPAPLGVPGEVHVGGGGLARGYLGRRALTADRFRPDPFSAAPGGRLYRTGDLARWRRGAGGSTVELEYLGRLDHQVQVRGFRVELGEVEAALRELPEVGEAVVVTDRDRAGLPRILAYLSPAPGARVPASTEIRRRLGHRLPDYMLPARIRTVAALPRTPSGKLDRGSLPAMDQEPSGHAPDTLPRGGLESAVAEIWCDLLEVPRVSRDESFFDLGGHSLLATRLVSRLRRTFQVDLPLVAVFDHPTVAGLAAVLGAARGGGGAVGRGSGLVPVERRGDLPLSFPQERFWVLEQLSPGAPEHRVSVALELEPAADAESPDRLGPGVRHRLASALTALVERHEVLRTAYREAAGEPVQRVLDPWPVTLPLVDLGALPGGLGEGELERCLGRRGGDGLDLAAGRPLRASLWSLSPWRLVARLTLHHIACDGWSMGVLVRDLAALFSDPAGGGLPALPVQYGDFAVWQRGDDRLDEELEYWRRELEGALPPRVALPTARSAGADDGVQLHPFELGEETTGRVRDLARRRGATPFMVLLASFQALLARYVGAERLWVGVPVAGRQRLETEGLVGFFLNTLLVGVDLSGDPTGRDLLERTRDRLLAAYGHQRVPYERVARELAGGARRGGPPQRPQVLFLFHNHPLPDLELPGLRLAPRPMPRQGAQAELALEMEERDGVFHGVLVAPAGRFDDAVLAELAHGLGRLLEGLAADPSRPVSEIALRQPPPETAAFTTDLEAW